jgi:hypothetical protein
VRDARLLSRGVAQATLSIDTGGIVNWNDGGASQCVPLFGDIVNTPLVYHCDALRGLVDVSCRGCDHMLVVGPPASGALFEVPLYERLFGGGKPCKWRLKPTCSISAASSVIIGAPPNTHPNAIVTPVIPSNFANPSLEWGVFAPPLQPVENPFVYHPNVHRPVCPPWLLTLQHALAFVVRDCVAVVGKGLPDCEVDEFLAPWLSLPVLSNGPSAVIDDDLIDKVTTNITALEDYFQALHPEPALLQRRAKFPGVEAVLIAALARQSGAATILLELVDSLSSQPPPSVLKSDPAALEMHRSRLSPLLSSMWARVKVFRQWLRGKKQFFQKCVWLWISFSAACLWCGSRRFECEASTAPALGVTVPDVPTNYWSYLSAVIRSNSKHHVRKQRVLETTPITFDEFLAGVAERLALLCACATPAQGSCAPEAAAQAILTYARYGTHAPPALIRRGWAHRQARAEGRRDALEKLARILNGDDSVLVASILVSSVRQSWRPLSFSDAETVFKANNHDGLLQLISLSSNDAVLSSASITHYSAGVEGCEGEQLTGMTSLVSRIVELTMQTATTPCNRQAALQLLAIDFQVWECVCVGVTTCHAVCTCSRATWSGCQDFTSCSRWTVGSVMAHQHVPLALSGYCYQLPRCDRC